MQRRSGWANGALALVLCLGAPVGAASADAPDCRLAALRQPGSDARLSAIEACGAARAPAAVEPLLEILAAPASAVMEQMAAVVALGEIGDPRATPVLLTVLADDMRRRRGLAMAAIPALGLLGDRRATPLLRAALIKRDDHWLGREAAARALGRIGDPSAVPDLIAAGWMADTRDAAIAALAAMAAPAAADLLLSALGGSEMEPETPALAADGLVAIGPPALAAIEAEAADDFRYFSEPSARARLHDALDRIGGARADLLRARLVALEALGSPERERLRSKD